MAVPLKLARGSVTTALVLAALTSVQLAQESPLLVQGVPVEAELASGQVHAYRLTLKRGDFVQLTIAQKGIDVAVALVRPDGTEVVAVDAMDDEFRPETIVASVDGDAIYAATVRSAAKSGAHGKYVISLEQARPAAAGDEVRIDAERAYARGRGRVDVNNAATWPDALADFRTARERFRSVGDRRGEMKALVEIGVVENFLSRPEAAETAREAEGLARALDDRPALARILRTTASIHRLAGNLDAAARAAEDATDINRAVGNRAAEARSLNFAAMVYSQRGDLERANAMLERALPIARSVGDRYFEATLLNNLGVSYTRLGEHEKAASLFEQSLAIARRASNPRTEFNTLNAIGTSHLQSGHHARARELFGQALAIARRSADRSMEAGALTFIGAVHHALGEYSAALDYHRDALAIYRQLGDVAGQAMVLSASGRAWHRLGDTGQALAALREAHEINRAIGLRLEESHTLRYLAAAERDRGDLAGALRHAEEAVDLDETVRTRITSPELRATYVAAEQDKYELLVDLLQQRHADDPAGGHSARALHVSERARARVLLESLLDARVDLREGIDPALLGRERTLQKQLDEASTRVSEERARNSRSDRASRAAETLERVTADYRRLQAEIREQSPRYAAVTQPRPLTIAQIRDTVLDADTVLLEFALGQERSWLWAVTSTTFTSVELPPRRDLDAAARSLYEQFTARQKRPGEQSTRQAERVAIADARLAASSAAMSRMLLGGVARQLNGEWKTKRLLIVAAGALEYLPFAALPAPGVDRLMPRPLARDHEIVTIPSASVLAVLRREAAGRAPAPRALAILADPVFDAADPRVLTARPSPQPPGPRDDETTRAFAEVDGVYARNGLARLPFSREEAEAIASLTGETGVLKAVDFKASRAAVLEGALRGYRIVHMATHGVIDSERPALSSLVLSLVDERGARQNGYLRLADIYNMRLDADLVVLSACQTALGKEIRGEGLVGLTRAFVYAGAPRVVASLWQVSDHATAELMKRFYRGMLQQHLPPAAALRAAQLQLSQDPRWSAPYFWAGFVLQGEWR